MGYTAIFGGTFNPFHIGHYEILKALQNCDFVDKIFIMPDRIPPHKVCDFMAEDEARIKMCEIVSKKFSKAQVCLVEFERDGKSYSYDTVRELKAKYPKENFAFVLGGDMLASFDKWYKYEELAKMLPFIAFGRTDTDDFLFDASVKKFSEIGMDIRVMKEKISSVSSTEIRNNIKSCKKLLPDEIYDFLKESGIYGAL